MFYRCIDKNGIEIISDHFLSETTCEPIRSFEEMTDQERVNYEKEKEDREKKRTDEYEKRRVEENAERNLNECFQRASKRYREGWDADCRLLNLNSRCDLPVENAKRWDYNLKEERKECFKLYPQKPYP
jgi:hypothetical protein